MKTRTAKLRDIEQVKFSIVKYVLTNDERPTEPRTYRNYYNAFNGEARHPQIEISQPTP